MRHFKVTVLMLFTSFSCFADIDFHHVTQSGAGLRDGSSRANAYSIHQFNNSENWTNVASNDNKIGPGDTVYFFDLITTRMDVKGSGTEEHPITLDGYKAGVYDAIARSPSPNNLATIKAVNEGIRIVGHDHFIIQDFQIDGDLGTANTEEGILLYDNVGDYSTDILIRDNYIHHIKNRGVFTSKSPNATHGTEHITIGGNHGDGNEFYSIGTSTAAYDVKAAYARDVVISYNKMWAPLSGSKYGNSGISWGDSREETQRMLIEYNYIASHNSVLKAEDGIGGKGGMDIVIRFNYVFDHHGQQEGTGIQACWGDSHRIYVYGNYVASNAWGMWVTSGSTAKYNSNGVGCDSIYIWGNVIADTKNGDAIRIGGWDGTDTHEDIYIYNNTIINNAINPTNFINGLDGNYTGISVIRTSKNVFIKNNIFYNNRPNKQDGNQIFVAPGLESTIQIENNQFFHSGGTTSLYWEGHHLDPSNVGKSNVVGDPLLEKRADGIYSLKESSPSLDSGYNLAGLIGTVVVQGVTYDMYWQEGISNRLTNWLTIPPTVKTMRWGIDKKSWDRGAYVEINTTTNNSPPMSPKLHAEAP